MVLYEIYKEDGGNGITFVHILYMLNQETFEDTKGVARIRKSKERQYNGHKKSENKTTRSPQKNTVVISFASEG